MTPDRSYLPPRAPARATIRSVGAAGLGTYRRRFWSIFVAAIVVFAPIDLVVTMAGELAKSAARKADVLSSVVWVSSAAVGAAGTMLSLVFFAGVIDRIVAVDQQGHDELPLIETLRRLPTVRLILASLLAGALVIAGFILLVVPGVVLMVLLGIVGPLIVIEELGVWRSLRRSIHLVWPHFGLVLVLVVVPTFAEESLTSWFERFHAYEKPLVHFTVDVFVTLLVGGLVGVLEVTAARALIADERRRAERQLEDAAVR